MKASLIGLQAPQSIWHLANFQDADCHNAIFTHADLIGSDLTGANFHGAGLYQTRLDQTIQKDTQFDFDGLSQACAPNKEYAAFVMANS